MREGKLLKQVLFNQFSWHRVCLGLLAAGSLLGAWPAPVTAQIQPYCHFLPEAIAKKENFRKAALKGSTVASKNYQKLVKKQAETLNQCRQQSWLKTQAVWLRLYPCDVRAGAIESILDRLVNKGYNRVYLEVFYDSQVLLPPADNPTVWQSVLAATPEAAKRDLLAEVIAKGRQRGLKVYAWVFTMNFGYSYSQRPDRQGVLARNGQGENSLEYVHDNSQAFIDPYNRQAQLDFYRLIQAVVARAPDGILFDYIRYPRGTGTQSVVSRVKDLWIYSPAAKRALYQRALNNQGQWLIHRFVNQGRITAADIQTVRAMAPREEVPLWQGRNPLPGEAENVPEQLQQVYNSELWNLTVAHAAQGVLDFLSFAATSAQQQGIPTGTVFFPGGNKLIGRQGFDSRLQAWHQFPAAMEWHPMSYSVCGQTDCIVADIQRVIYYANPKTQIVPAIAGIWGAAYKNRPSLEEQMEAIRWRVPEVNSLSHFAYSWQEQEFDRERKFCQVTKQ